jgi:NADPH-dependent 2,4-dienoyl-CoA reductase/sulfur reductase-like enzyme
MVLMALGVIPNVELAKEAGIELGKTGAIRTDETQSTNLKDIYTAGDCCEVFNLVSKDWVHTPLGDIANKQGRVAGENAAGGKAIFSGVVGSAAFKVFELEVAFTGLGMEVARKYGFDVDSQIIEAESKVGYMPGSKGMLIKLIFDRKNGRVLGAQMAGKEGVARRINSLAVALHQNMTIDEIARLDFAYAPPFSSTLDPILIAAEQATKKVRRSL